MYGEGEAGVISTKHLEELVLLQVASLTHPQSSFGVFELFLNLDCKLPEGSNQVILLLYFLKYWSHSRYSINTCYLFFSVKFLWLFFQVAGFRKMVKGTPVLKPVFVPALFSWSPNTSHVFPVNIFIF